MDQVKDLIGHSCKVTTLYLNQMSSIFKMHVISPMNIKLSIVIIDTSRIVP